jgi:hypothetical protein
MNHKKTKKNQTRKTKKEEKIKTKNYVHYFKINKFV